MYFDTLDDRGAGRIPAPQPHFRCSYGLTVNLSKSLCFVHRRNRRTSIFVTLLIRREFCIVSDPQVSSSTEIEKTEKFFRRPCRHARGPAQLDGRTARQPLSYNKERRRVRQEPPLTLSQPPGLGNQAGCFPRHILYDHPPKTVRSPPLSFAPLSALSDATKLFSTTNGRKDPARPRCARRSQKWTHTKTRRRTQECLPASVAWWLCVRTK